MQHRRVKIVLVEDHAKTREELARIFEEFDPIEFVAAWPSAEAMLRALPNVAFEVALVDLALPGMSGSKAIRALAERLPNARAIALTASDDETSVMEAVRAGAFGYLLKDEPIERLLDGVQEAASGVHPISSRVAGFLIAHARRAPPPISLSDREHELAEALAAGLTYAECATRMGIGLGTVQAYVKRLYRKLDVGTRAEVKDWVKRHLDPP